MDILSRINRVLYYNPMGLHLYFQFGIRLSITFLSFIVLNMQMTKPFVENVFQSMVTIMQVVLV